MPHERGILFENEMSLLDSSITFIVCRHEKGAAFIADVYGRLTGKPGVCLGTLGPGATNLLTGVADADMDRSPLIVITGQGSTDRLDKESHQAMDVVTMFGPVGAQRCGFQLLQARMSFL